MVTMGITNQQYSVSNIREAISQNRTTEVTQILRDCPALLMSNLDLIKNARTSEMVETLLGLKSEREINGSCIESPSKNYYETEKDHLEIFIKCLPTILQRWPLVALKVLDRQTKYSG